MTLLAFFLFLSHPASLEISVEPLTIHGKEELDIPVRGVLQLGASDEHLYLRLQGYPRILVLDRQASILTEIGGREPTKTTHMRHPLAFNLNGKQVWLHGPEPKNMAIWEDGELSTAFSLRNWYLEGRHSSNDFAFVPGEGLLVVQASPRTRATAAAYDSRGVHLGYFGKIVPIDPTALKRNPALNDTLWQSYGHLLVCLWKYRPVIQIFGTDRKLKRTFSFDDPPPLTPPMDQPLYVDCEVSGDWLYVLDRQGALSRINLKSQIRQATWVFKAATRLKPLPFHRFTLLGNQIFLAHPYLKWGHDLWRACLPDSPSR